MATTKQIQINRTKSRQAPMHTFLPSGRHEAAEAIVKILLGEARLCEATVHRPKRGRRWAATFTGPAGRQIWRSTGLTDRDQALMLARHWESEARAQRAKLGRALGRPFLRVRRPEAGIDRSGLLTQKEVAQLLGMSERGVREVERRVFQKLRNHPLLRQMWQQYLAGELDEHQPVLSSEEIEALLNVARTSEELALIQKVVRLLQR